MYPVSNIIIHGMELEYVDSILNMELLNSVKIDFKH